MNDPRPTVRATAPVRPAVRLSQVHYPVTALGPGRRLGLWLQGCGLACPGCIARDTWDRDGGRAVPVTVVTELWRRCLDAGADGVTISGGEPLDQADALAVLLADLAQMRDERRSEADLLLFTGYSTEEAHRRGTSVLRHTDAVITGRYLRSRPTSLVWRGSANQQLVPLSSLGVARYERHRHRQAPDPSLQVLAGGPGEIRIIGVPRAGDLERIEAELRTFHVRLAATWHEEPPAPPFDTHPR